MYTILRWYSKSAESDSKVCWQTHYKTALDRYENVLGALNSLFVDPESLKKGEQYARRPMDLPPLYLDTTKLHCLHPNAGVYGQMTRLLHSSMIVWSESTQLEKFRKEADKVAHPFGRALFHAARETYRCPYQKGCTAEGLWLGSPYVANSFKGFLGTIRSVFDDRKAMVCLAFDGVLPMPRSAVIFAAGVTEMNAPNMLYPRCQRRACYSDFQMASRAGSDFCNAHHLEHELSWFVRADTFSQPTECGKPKLVLLDREIRSLCDCVLGSSDVLNCANMSCYEELITVAKNDREELKRQCKGRSMGSRMANSFPHHMFPFTPTCGLKMVEFSIDERRDVCGCLTKNLDGERRLQKEMKYNIRLRT
ncbi:hypothetical protein GQ602_000972 [Ophiocordyceps camponoti-floridani]|uniref:Uncharacterized protein n=1 Tax=Ophiocordyceps camponoti-floridani TaxID=2030778 RepID=A0A8H4QD54_9HYPO|nr:hypothetical protein GQ602_000972 [Ophiocordyceps camponoti-floridani]